MCKSETRRYLNRITHEVNKFALVALGVAFSLSFVTPVYASSDSVELKLSATIEESCAVTRSDGVTDTVFSDDDGKMEIGLTVNCNTPFEYSLTSDKGALVNDSTTSIGMNSDSILTELTYSTKFEMTGLEDGDTSAIDQTCSSTALGIKNGDGTDNPSCTATTEFATSGTSIAINKPATLSLSIDNYTNGFVNNNPLLSGTFEDGLTLTVRVQP